MRRKAAGAREGGLELLEESLKRLDGGPSFALWATEGGCASGEGEVHTPLVFGRSLEGFGRITDPESVTNIAGDKLDLAVFVDGSDVAGAGEGEGLEGGHGS